MFKLDGTDKETKRQADRQTDRPGSRGGPTRGGPPKNQTSSYDHTSFSGRLGNLL